jgi:hypothetical protein
VVYRLCTTDPTSKERSRVHGAPDCCALFESSPAAYLVLTPDLEMACERRVPSRHHDHPKIDHRASDVIRPSARTNVIRRANVSGHGPVFLLCREFSFKHGARPVRQLGRRLVSAVPNTVTRGELT